MANARDFFSSSVNVSERLQSVQGMDRLTLQFLQGAEDYATQVQASVQKAVASRLRRIERDIKRGEAEMLRRMETGQPG